MKRVIAFFIASTMSILFSGAVLAQTDQFELIGFSSQGSSGNGGVVFFTANRCQIDFPDSRMCTSEEVMNSTMPPIPSGGSVFDLHWVRPSFVPGSGAANRLDASGVEGTASALTCAGWSNINGTGLAVNKLGRFSLQPCTTAKAIACCALVKIKPVK